MSCVAILLAGGNLSFERIGPVKLKGRCVASLVGTWWGLCSFAGGGGRFRKQGTLI